MAVRPRRRFFSTARASAIALTGLMLTLSLLAETAAKRGCSAFGHSCYGGHGKRSSYPESTDQLLELNQPRSLGGIKDDSAPPDYDLQLMGARQPNPESAAAAAAALMRAADLVGRQRAAAAGGGGVPPPSSNSWSILVRKLLLPLRRPYLAYSETQK